nr:uncharacterized protein LOC127339904 [Lolium perenne]
MEATSDGETIIDDLVIGDVHSMEKLTHLQKPTIKKSRKVKEKQNDRIFMKKSKKYKKRDISSNAQNNDSIPKDECAEELHQEISKKKDQDPEDPDQDPADLNQEKKDQDPEDPDQDPADLNQAQRSSQNGKNDEDKENSGKEKGKAYRTNSEPREGKSFSGNKYKGETKSEKKS